LTNEEYKRFYHANKCSCATLFCLIMYSIAILLPFFLAFSTANFWLHVDRSYEQPIVDARNEYIIYGMQSGTTYAFSNVDFVNSLYQKPLVSPTYRIQLIDNNNDGKNDMIQATISFFSSTAQLTNVQLLIFFNYGLRNVINMQMQDFVRISLSSTTGISKAYVTGSVGFKQVNPIQDSTIVRKIYNQSIFEDPTQNFDIMSIINAQQSKNETLFCDCQNVVIPGGLNNYTEINVMLTIPSSQEIAYIPSILENLKFAWIQYMALFIPIFYIVDKIMKFIYKNRVFPTQELNDLPIKKIKTS